MTPPDGFPAMQYVRLGNSGLKISKIILGCMTYGTPQWRDWVLDEAQTKPFIRRALELGINFFDTADLYSAGVSEQVLGNILREFGVSREEVIIATKVYMPTAQKPNCSGLSRKHIFHALENSLRRLQMDYVDLYQIHRFDEDTPVDELMSTLNDLVRSGKVRYIGASSMYAWQFQACQNVAEQRGWAKFVSMQNHYNLLYKEEEREMIPYCNYSGVGLLPWSPLARGVLCGRAKDGTTRAKSDQFSRDYYSEPQDEVIAQRVQEVATKKGVPPARVALAWLLHKPRTTPIIGASKLYQLEDAVLALSVKLTEEEIKYIEEPYKPKKVLGPPPAPNHAAHGSNCMAHLCTGSSIAQCCSAHRVLLSMFMCVCRHTSVIESVHC